MAKLIRQFDLTLLLNPLYLVDRARLSARHPLTDPRTYWVARAKDLDKAKQSIRSASAEAQWVSQVLGRDSSFEAKGGRFFNEAANELSSLDDRGVSPNVVAASMVLYAWDWRVPDRNPAHKLIALGDKKLMQHLRRAAVSAKVPDDVLALALQHDLLFPKNAKLHAALLANPGQLAALTPALCTAARQIRALGLSGRLPDDKVNTLVILLTLLINECAANLAPSAGVQPLWQGRFACVAELLLTADIVSRRSRDQARRIVYERFEAYKNTAFGLEVALRVRLAIQDATVK